METPQKTETQTISVRVPVDVAREIEMLARKSGRSKSSHIVEALEDYTNREVVRRNASAQLLLLDEIARNRHGPGRSIDEIDKSVADIRADRDFDL